MWLGLIWKEEELFFVIEWELIIWGVIWYDVWLVNCVVGYLRYFL